jgi:hypothetical protein
MLHEVRRCTSLVAGVVCGKSRDRRRSIVLSPSAEHAVALVASGIGDAPEVGLNVQLGYKNFDLSMFFQGVCGVDVYNNQKAQTDFWSIVDAGSNKGTRLLGAWNTNNTSSTIPALTTNNTADEGRASSYYVENGSYMKLRTLQLGYTVPATFLSKFKMSSARIYLSGQNLLTIKSKSLTCPDPENPNWNYPLATSVSFGLQIGF